MDTTSRASRLAAGLLATTVATVLALALGAAPASAHATLVGTDPVDGGVVEQAPEAMVLSFSEPMAQPAQVTITGPDGVIVDEDTPEIDGAEVRLPVTLPDAGVYTVTWRVVSADGHPIDGTFSFELTPPDEPDEPDAAADAEEGEPEPEQPAEPAPDADAGDGGAAGTDSGDSGDDEAGAAADDAAADDAADLSNATTTAATPDSPVLWILVGIAALAAVGAAVFGSRMRGQRG